MGNINVISDSIVSFDITVPQRFHHNKYYINFQTDTSVGATQYTMSITIKSLLDFQPKQALLGDTITMQIGSDSRFYNSGRNKLFLSKSSSSIATDLFPIQYSIMDSNRIQAKFIAPTIRSEYYLIYINDTSTTDTIFNYDRLDIDGSRVFFPDNGYEGDSVDILIVGKNFFQTGSNTINQITMDLPYREPLNLMNLNVLNSDSAQGTFYLPYGRLEGEQSIIGYDTTTSYSRVYGDFRIKNTEHGCESYTWLANMQNYQTSGLYYDTTLDRFGFDSINVLNLKINPIPIANIKQGSRIGFCGKDSIELSNSSNSSNYEWSKIQKFAKTDFFRPPL